MALSPQQIAAITHQRRKATAEKDQAIERRRLSVAVGDDLVDGTWSNASFEWFCRSCAHLAPPPAVTLGADRGTCCSRCQQPLTSGRVS